MEILRDWELVLTADHVLRGQGADPKVVRQRRPALVQAAQWALEEGRPLLEPAVLVETREVQGLRHERLQLEGGSWLSGSLIAQHLAGAQRLALMVCTIGPHLESLTAELMKEDPLLGIAMEGVGTAAVESLATHISRRLEAQAEQDGWQTSIPLSPGMVGWAVDPGQRQIFGLLDAKQIGVHLTSSWMMLPRMSISQVIGMGPQMVLQGRTCDYCSLKETCRYQDHYA